MKSNLIKLSGLVMGLAPVVALAQVSTGGSSTACTVTTNNGTLFNILCQVGQLLNAIVPVLIALAIVIFVWGVIQYVISSDEEDKKKGRDKIIYGVIGLAVIVAVWGLVRVLTNTFGLNNTTVITLPTVPVVIPTP